MTQGLTTLEARLLLEKHGPNRLPSGKQRSLANRIAAQLRSPIVYILLFGFVFEAGYWAFEGARGVPFEAVTIAAALLVNAFIGTLQEYRGEKAIEKLRAIAAPRAWAYRDGRLASVAAEEIVPGDLIRVEAGDRLHADGRLVHAQSVLVDESMLTGESLPIEKRQDDDASSGTMLVRGQASLLVTRTGASSAMGALAAVLGGIEVTRTPLEKRLHVFGNRVAVGVVILGLLILLVGVAVEGRAALVDIVFFAVALAVATVPEELPTVLALTLSLGVERMAGRKALVKRLSAVEALGSVTVIATDKTGTLTENKLRVRRLHAVDERAALRAMVLANDADLASGVGDPLEVAFLVHGEQNGIDIVEERRLYPRVSQTPFDSAWKYMRVTLREDDELVSYLKGAPEVILSRCAMNETERERFGAIAEEEAREGYRVLALARASGEKDDQLLFLGLVSLWDPPRAEVPEAIRRAREAGVRVLMITGDHPATARAIATEVGIESGAVLTGADLERMDANALRDALAGASVFARVTPEQKLRVVEALQARDEIVAVTGDGINDAPALKRADVGIAMGQRGSDVAREVASLVLLDDNFATIVTAIEEGRSLYENIQKFIRFMFSTSLGLLVLILVGFVGSWAFDARAPSGALFIPLTAIQILFINLFVDGPPSLAIGLDRNPDVMRARPRAARAPLMDRASLAWVVFSGLTKAGIGLVLLFGLPAVGYSLLIAQTALFAYEYLAQLVYAYPARKLTAMPQPNRALLATILLVALVPIVLFVVPGARTAFQLETLTVGVVGIVLLAVLASWAMAELVTRALRASASANRRGPT